MYRVLLKNCFQWRVKLIPLQNILQACAGSLKIEGAKAWWSNSRRTLIHALLFFLFKDNYFCRSPNVFTMASFLVFVSNSICMGCHLRQSSTSCCLRSIYALVSFSKSLVSNCSCLLEDDYPGTELQWLLDSPKILSFLKFQETLLTMTKNSYQRLWLLVCVHSASSRSSIQLAEVASLAAVFSISGPFPAFDIFKDISTVSCLVIEPFWVSNSKHLPQKIFDTWEMEVQLQIFPARLSIF